MNWRYAVIAALLIPFGGLSLWAMLEVGYLGIWQGGLTHPGAIQILADLVVACTLLMVWMVLDARRHGLNAWPFVAITLAAGAFGPLLYLLRRELAVPKAALVQS